MLPPGYASSLQNPATAGLGSATLPPGVSIPGYSPMAFGPPPAYAPYGSGPEPFGSRVGTDDVAQMLGGISPSDGGVAGDATPEDSFYFPDAIDTEIIKKAKDKSWITDLENEVYDLIEEGVAARRGGGRDEWIGRWRRLYENGDSPGRGPWSGSSRIVPPDMRAAIESIVARDMEAIFASRERVRIKTRPSKPQDELPGKALVIHIDDFMHTPEIDLRSRLTRAASTGRVDGTILCDCFWRREKQKRRRRVRITNDILWEFRNEGKTTAPIQNPDQFPYVYVSGKRYRYGQIATLEQEVITRNHFDFQFINLQDFFMYPATSRSIEDATIAGYDFWQTENEMRVCAFNGSYDKKAVEELFDKATGKSPMPETFDPTTANSDDKIRDDSLGIASTNEGDTHGFARYRMRKFWARVRDVNNDGLFEDCLVIQEYSTRKIVFLQADPYDNLKRSLMNIDFDPRIGGGFYGYSLVEKMRDAHLELQAVARLGIDLSVLAGSITIPVQGTIRNRPEDWVFRPGVQFWNEEERGTLGNPIAMPMVQNQYIPDRAYLSSCIEKTSGAGEILTGATPEGGTATATNIQVTSSGIRSKTMLLNQLKFLTWLYNQYRDYTTQFMEETQGKSFAVSLGPGRGFEDITLETISIEGAITAYCEAIDPDVALKLQAAEKVFTLLSQFPLTVSDITRQWQVTFDYIKEIYKDFVPGPRMGTYEEAQKAQAAQAEAEAAQAKQSEAEKVTAPPLPPNMSVEYMPWALAMNPGSEKIILPLYKMVKEIESAGKLKEQSVKIAGEAITQAIAPPKPETNGSVGANHNQSQNRKK